VRSLFVDTSYWIASIHPDDQWHPQAAEAEKQARGAHLVTTDSVLIELLNYFCSFRPEVRELAAGVGADILADPEIEAIPHSRELLLSALELYASRRDKQYSLTD
jgi:predicted nucleic acid-binding protein